MCDVDAEDGLYGMLWTLGLIEELLMAIIALKEVPASEPLIAKLIVDTQHELAKEPVLKWVKVDRDNVEQQLAIVRRFSNLLMRMRADTLH